MRIASGTTDQYLYFVSVRASDFTTRVDTGLNFTVKRSRNGGAWTTFTTPTVNATDTGGDGIFELLLDEDMSIDAGDFTQEMVLHIEDTGGTMAAVTRVIELFRPPGGDTGRLNVNIVEVKDDTGGAQRLQAFSSIKLTDSGTFDTGTGQLQGAAASVDTGAVNQAVWQADASRILTGFTHDTGVADTVWKSSNSTYTDTGSLGYGVNVHKIRGDTGIADNLNRIMADTGTGSYLYTEIDTGGIADAIWAKSTRSITSVDANAVDTGVFTGTAAKANDTGAFVNSIWAATSRVATSVSGNVDGSVASVTTVSANAIDTGSHTGMNSIRDTGIADAVWEYATRAITSVDPNSIDTGAYTGSLLTGSNHDTGIAHEVWKIAVSGYATDTGSFGEALGQGVNVTEIFGDTGSANHLQQWLADDTGTPRVDVQKIDGDTGAADSLQKAYADTGGATTDTGAINRAIWEPALVDGIKPIEALRGIASVLLGTVTGAGTGTEVFAELDDTGTPRITATVDSVGNRTVITRALDT